MKDRIRQIMEAQHMTQQVFADFIGTNPATLSGIFNDRTRPTLNIVEAIKRKIPDISTDWLMFGTGHMYQHPSLSTGNAQITSSDDWKPSPDNRQNVPVGSEQMIDFDPVVPPTPQSAPAASSSYNSVRNTQQFLLREEVKHLDKPQRRVTEIRVYYDDQTWESFVPSKK
ncbi:MAG: helix-turn-helix domain-containing protein [Prevotella sp.]|nr:helix-turn-helix domain-containing protein [Prevotella sp.]